jgi:hypothetical protein
MERSAAAVQLRGRRKRAIDTKRSRLARRPERSLATPSKVLTSFSPELNEDQVKRGQQLELQTAE